MQRSMKVLSPEWQSRVREGVARTLEEIGIEFGITRERVRQIEDKALRKLRQPHRLKHLRDFFNDKNFKAIEDPDDI